MRTEKSATPSSWDVNGVRSRLLNSPSPGQDTRPLLLAFLRGKGHIQVIRQLVAGEQAKLLEIIDQVSTGRRYHPSMVPVLKATKYVGPDADFSEHRLPRASRTHRPHKRHEVRGCPRGYRRCIGKNH